MTDIETSLTQALRARADDVGPTAGDPWLRVDRAHRRARVRRRAAAAGALAAVLATGVVVTVGPWSSPAGRTQPADQQPDDRDGLRSSRLDDGRPRGVTPTPLQMPAVQAALAGAHGPGVDAATTGTAAVSHLLTSLGATADRVTVKALWAGRNPDGDAEVKPDERVAVTHGAVTLTRGPATRDAGSSPYAPGP